MTLRGSFANTALASQTNSPSFTLPSGIKDGDEGLMQLSCNGASALLNDSAGWTVVDGPQTNPSSTLRSWLLRKTLAASDAGSTVTFALSAGFRWTVSGVVTFGVDMDSLSATAWLDNTDDLNLAIPSIVPAAGFGYDLFVLAGIRYASTTGKNVTPVAPWTELQDQATTNGTSPTFGTWVGQSYVSKANSGSATSAVNMTYGANARNNAWIVAVPYPGRIEERWTGTGLVPVRSDKWNGTTLVKQVSQN